MYLASLLSAKQNSENFAWTTNWLSRSHLRSLQLFFCYFISSVFQCLKSVRKKLQSFESLCIGLKHVKKISTHLVHFMFLVALSDQNYWHFVQNDFSCYIYSPSIANVLQPATAKCSWLISYFIAPQRVDTIWDSQSPRSRSKAFRKWSRYGSGSNLIPSILLQSSRLEIAAIAREFYLML